VNSGGATGTFDEEVKQRRSAAVAVWMQERGFNQASIDIN